MPDFTFDIKYEQGNVVWLSKQSPNINGDQSSTWAIPESLGPVVIQGMQLNAVSLATPLSDPEHNVVLVNATTTAGASLWWRQSEPWGWYSSAALTTFISVGRAVAAGSILQIFHAEVDTSGSPTADMNVYLECVVPR